MNRDEFRKKMADAFVSVLSEKGLSWKKEWSAAGGAPQNVVTKAFYRGCNQFLLSLIAISRGYSDPRWATMVQIMDLQGKYHPDEKWHLKAGSKAAYVEYWYPFDLKHKKALTWDQLKKELSSGRKEEEFRLSTKYTPVFNACDVEGMQELNPDKGPKIQMDDLVARLSKGMSVPIFFDGGDKAYYSPRLDEIHLPKMEAFENAYAFNSTALHELAHSTGHTLRLNRAQTGIFGLDTYAYEELVAEMASCFMGSDLKTEPSICHIQNHKAYVQAWIKGIQDKPETLLHAVKDAQAAAAYMDWKAGLITDIEYVNAGQSVIEICPRESIRQR